MGGSNSKRFNRNNKNDEVDGIVDRRIKNEPIRTAELMDRQYIEDIKKDLCENPEMFVLNNMLMAVMFFENYPRLVADDTVKCLFFDKSMNMYNSFIISQIIRYSKCYIEYSC